MKSVFRVVHNPFAAMRPIREARVNPRLPALLLMPVVAFVGLAGHVTAGQPTGVVNPDNRDSVFDLRSAPQDSHQRFSPTQEPESPTAALSKQDDAALRRGLPSGNSVARLRKGAGSWYVGKLFSSRRPPDFHLTLSGADVATRSWQLHAIVQVSWPMGRSAAESVVLLRRLLI